MDELIKNINKWFYDRKITNIDYQLQKLTEEKGEMVSAYIRGNKEKTKDGIGDMFIVLNGIAKLMGWTLKECVEYAYNEIKDRDGVTKNGTFIKSE